MVVPQLLSLCVHHWEGKMFQWAQLKIQTRYPDTSEQSARLWTWKTETLLRTRLPLSEPEADSLRFDSEHRHWPHTPLWGCKPSIVISVWSAKREWKGMHLLRHSLWQPRTFRICTNAVARNFHAELSWKYQRTHTWISSGQTCHYC